MNRQTKLQDLGAKFIRISDVDVKKNMNGVLSALENKIDEGTYPPLAPNTKTQVKTGRGCFDPGFYTKFEFVQHANL